MFVVAFKAKPEDPWSVYKCKRSGEITFDLYRACHEARRLCREGYVESKVMKGEEEVAKFSRSATGNVTQLGGVDL